MDGIDHANTVPAALATTKHRGNTSVSLASSIDSLSSNLAPKLFFHSRLCIKLFLSFDMQTVGFINPRTRPRYCRCATTIDSLPDELLFEILARVPAEDIHEKARFVCRRWKGIIHGKGFAYAHLHHTSSGLVITEQWDWQTRKERRNASLLVTATQGRCRFETSALSYKFGFTILASCNGLVLEMDLSDRHALYIVNPATNRSLNRAIMCHFGIAFVAASIEYKVVVTYISDWRSRLVECTILTVGVDNAWRHVAIDKLSIPTEDLLYLYEAFSTDNGFVHWASRTGTRVFSLNAETEIVTLSPVPLPPEYRDKSCLLATDEELMDRRVDNFRYLSTGRHLSLLIDCGDLLREIWEMRGESGEWRKLLPNIDLRAHKGELRRLTNENEEDFIVPIGWVEYLEVLAFASYDWDRYCIMYDLGNDKISSFEFPDIYDRYYFQVHRKSLVWIS